MEPTRYDRTLTEVEGFRVGHAEDRQALTGVTLVLSPEGAVGGLCQLGGAVGGRQLSPLDPQHLVDRVHGVLLAGGSAFGLAATDGVLAALELARGDVPAEPHRVGLLAREALEAAMLRAVLSAEPLGGLPAARDLGSRSK